jgi:hypothetical protein
MRKWTLTPAMIIGVWLVLFAVVWITRSRALKFAWILVMVTPLPVAFIAPRIPAQYYVPYFGWVLYAAVALTEGSRWLLRGAPELAQSAWAMTLCTVVAAIMYSVNIRYPWSQQYSVSVEGEELRAIVTQLHHLRPTMRHGARVLFLDDPIDERWRMMFVMRLSYHDNDLVIDRAKYMPVRPTAQQIASYDYVFDFHIGQFYSAAYPHRDGPEPAIEFEREHPCVFHNDWTPVTARYPARRGEHLISMVRDLGVTEPPVSPGKPFPDSPLVDVVAPVEVRVGSRKAEVLLKIGWPQEVNKYRLDFRIPRDVRPGAELVEIRCREATGPAAPIEIE